MAKPFTFTLDDTCVEWYDYHFQDTLLRNDIVWRCWRQVVQKYLSPEQQAGTCCAVCGVAIAADAIALRESVGGYRVAMCVRRCETPRERAMRESVEAVESVAQTHKKALSN